MKKQGFTLIELMVVIVIMGILAAVAVPKLFGMIAKSKASEVGPAAGTYVKLQDAYVAETGAYFGSWDKVGYTGPGAKQTDGTFHTTQFIYSDPYTGYASGSAALGSAAIVWQAHNVAKLNDCAIGDNWKLSVSKASGNTNGEYKWSVTNPSTCSVLTPSFSNFAN